MGEACRTTFYWAVSFCLFAVYFMRDWLVCTHYSFSPSSSSVYMIMKDHFVCLVDAEEINEPNKPPNSYLLTLSSLTSWLIWYMVKSSPSCYTYSEATCVIEAA